MEARVRPDIEVVLRDRAETLRRLSGFTWLGLLLRWGLRARIVPAEYWSREEGMTIGEVAELRCQCGVLHVLDIGAFPQLCPCNRAFFYDGTDVWALNSPAA